MMRLFSALAALLLLAAPATDSIAQEQVIGALSQNRISITTNFDGSEIFVFGAVKRDAPVPGDVGPLHVVITVAGPSEPVMVRRKDRTLGIWVNRQSVEIDEAPTFYAIATTAPLNEIMSETERLRHSIGFDKVVKLVGAGADVTDPTEFTDALVRIRIADDLYRQENGNVELREETLFTSSIALPTNLVEGDYRTTMYLLRDRQVIHQTETAIEVRKAGLEALIYNTAHEQPLLYGLLSVAVALAAGWLASEAFRLLRR